MSKLIDLLPERIKRKQKLLFWGLMLLFMFIIVLSLFFYDSANRESKNASLLEQNTTHIQIGKLGSGVKAEDRFLHKYESKIKDVDKQLGEYKEENEGLKRKLDDIQNEVTKRSESEDAGVIDSLAAEIGKLREELEEMRNQPVHSAPIKAGVNNFGSSPYLDGRAESNTKKIVDFKVGLDSEFNKRKLITHNLEYYIPPNTMAPAVITSSIDAPAGVDAQNNPGKIYLRIIGSGRTAANKGVVQTVDLAGCTLEGAAWGDLSSERVNIRLTTMSCSRQDGTSVETPVTGSVSSVGKSGVRGDVVSRSGDLVFKSFLSGVLSSAGAGVTQRFGTPVGIVGGFAAQQPTTSDVVSSSLGNGVTTAGNKVSDYFIKLAEHYQPVISISNGIEVQVIFQEGTYIDGSSDSTAPVTEVNGGLE